MAGPLSGKVMGIISATPMPANASPQRMPSEILDIAYLRQQYGCNTLTRVLRFATMVKDSTRTLLFGIFVMSGRRMTAAQVIALARSIGVSATNEKSHLTRMVADGALQRSGPVRRALYWPSRSQAWIVEGILGGLRQV